MTTPPYQRVTFEGYQFNARTVAGIKHARDLFAALGGTGSAFIVQGSYSSGPNSAGTHEGGGAVDLDLTDESAANWLTLEWAMRLGGWADWDRPPTNDWGHHNHGIMIGDREMHSTAEAQVQYYRLGYDGLAGHWSGGQYVHSKDPHPRRPDPVLAFAYPLKTVILDNVQREARKTKGWVELDGVRYVQRTLNAKIDAGLTTDGVWGPKTKRVYARYEETIGGDGDGVPGEFSLTLLGAARFRVT